MSISVYSILIFFEILLIIEILTYKGKIISDIAWSIILISLGNLIFFLPLFESKLLFITTPIFFIPLIFIFSPKSPIKFLRLKSFQNALSIENIILLILMTIIVWIEYDAKWIALASIFSMVWGIKFIQTYLKNHNNQLLRVMLTSLVTWLSIFTGILFLNYSFSLAAIVSSIMALTTVIVVFLSSKKFEAFILPFFNLIVLYLLEDKLLMVQINKTIYIVAIILGAFVAIASFKLGFLTADGAITGFVLAIIMLGLTGWTFGAQLFLFFLIGSLATKIVGKLRGDIQKNFEKGAHKRDGKQAIAKAGSDAVICIIYVIYPQIELFYFYSGVLTTAITDTMATEVGITFKGTPRKILQPWKKAEKGESGAISFIGTIGGVFFGLVFTMIVYSINLVEKLVLIDSRFLIIVVFGGLLGMFADSAMGASIQRMNKCVVCDKILEANIHHNRKTEYYRGIRIFNNDAINFTGTLIGGVVSYLLAILIL